MARYEDENVPGAPDIDALADAWGLNSANKTQSLNGPRDEIDEGISREHIISPFDDMPSRHREPDSVEKEPVRPELPRAHANHDRRDQPEIRRPDSIPASPFSSSAHGEAPSRNLDLPRVSDNDNRQNVDGKWKLLAGGATGLLILGTLGYCGLSSGGSSNHTPAPSKTIAAPTRHVGMLSNSVPQGMTQSYEWSDQTNTLIPAVLANGTVAYQSNSGNVSIVNVDTGKTVQTLNSSGVQSILAIGDATHPGVVWVDSTQGIYYWFQGMKSPQQSSSTATLYGSGKDAITWSQGDNKVVDISSKGEQSIQIPDGSVPMAANDQCITSANSDAKIWTSCYGKPSTSQSIDIPSSKIVRRWLGMYGTTFAVVLDQKGAPDNSRTVDVAFYNSTTGKMISKTSTKWSSVSTQIMVSDQNKRALAVGPVVFDGTNASTADNQNVNVFAVSPDGTAYGINGTNKTEPGFIKSGKWTQYDTANYAIPIGYAQSGNGIVKIGSTLYALKHG